MSDGPGERSKPVVLRWLLVSIAVIGIVGLLLASYVDVLPPKYYTMLNMKLLRMQIETYHEVYGDLPGHLSDLPGIRGREKPTFLDGYGKTIDYELRVNGQICLRSFGKDGKAGGTGKNADIVMCFLLGEPWPDKPPLRLVLEGGEFVLKGQSEEEGN
jgi:hypothetical protein